ncbi:MAM3 [[Candida] subhashii]|uniref:MAM3 n=1 Tax=[Candida] subhashii TaxID=561895 RepID=A0A8J5QJ71_9ASCO|nr:MAM3 [[Candida] subhashii]KAG7663088.1 MAM3 [[Candida] subhashii]
MSNLSRSRNNHAASSLTRSNSSITKFIFIFSQLFKLAHSLPIFSSTVSNSLNHNDYADTRETMTREEFYVNLFTSIFLVLAGGVFAGLTLGLMGQDEVYLKVIATSGEPKERKHARKVLELIGRGKHWVLVTLLLSNVITNESLPIVLDNCLGGGWPAVVTSTVAIVIFGEIIPQSICVRYGLQVGALFAPFVLCLMYIMYPVAYPCALLLDHILGEDHGTVYKKSGLKTLVTLHRTMGVERLNQDEVTIISAVLDLKEKPVSSIMTPMERVYTMSADTLLDEKTVEEIFNAGFSRIPIHLPNEPYNFIGMLLVRVLISYDPEDALPVASFPLATLPETALDTSCLNILNYFQEGKSHMIVVSDHPGEPTGAVGVLTLEDVIEELIGEEIVDESDVYIDINKNIKRTQPGPLSKRNLTTYLHSLYQRSGPNSKRNSLDSSTSHQHVDLVDRLKKGSETTISSTPNSFHKDQQPPLALLPPSATPTPGLPQTSGDSSSAVGKNWKPKNPAANPLETNKKFVTIKRPNQDTIDSVTKAASPSPIPKQYGAVYPTEQGAIIEAQRRSFESERYPHYHYRHHNNSTGNHRFLLPEEREADVSEINEEQQQDGYHGHIHHNGHVDVPIATRIPNKSSPMAIPEYQEARSYKTGGIIESVINVDGVHKTIIENVSDDDDGVENPFDDILSNNSDNDNDERESKKNKRRKKKKTSAKKKTKSTPVLRSDSFNLNSVGGDRNRSSHSMEIMDGVGPLENGDDDEGRRLLVSNGHDSDSHNNTRKKISVWDRLTGSSSPDE